VTTDFRALPDTPVSHAGLSESQLTAFLTRHLGPSLRLVRLEAQPLRGGLDAAAVASIRAFVRDGSGRVRQTRFVAKRLDGPASREATVYHTLLAGPGSVLAPRLLDSEQDGPDRSCLYLEHVTPWRRWPWPDLTYARLVLEQFAILHILPAGAAFVHCSATWDYEAMLATSAKQTLDLLEVIAVDGDDPAGFGEACPMVRCIVAALPQLRRALLATAPFGVVPIHGDAHPGNVIIRAQGASPRPIFLDWSRARLGSPLEDVASWLHWLGYWVPAARQHHDHLLRHFLRARGLSRHVSREVRTALWLAETCNVLGGALRYHLAVLEGWGAPSPAARTQAAHAARDCLRVIRRADHLWRA
jgi:hypothetical protein